MPTNRKVIDFKIHNLTEEQFQELKEAGQIDPNAIYCTPDETVANFEAVNARIDETVANFEAVNARIDETDDKLDKKVSVAQGEENAGKVLVVNEDGEVVPDKPKVGASLPILMHVFADHELNDMSWLRADTFSWQSGDVYKAAYEHLANEAIFESETKKYIRCKTATASGGYRDDEDVYYREPSYDLSDDIVYTEGYAFAWVSVSSDRMVITNTETPAESDVIYYRSKIYPEDPPPSSGRVVEAGEVIVSGDMEIEKIDGITIAFYRAEDGHKICPVNQEANVQTLYEKTGVAWYYILDIKNKQFKLPRTKFGFTGLRDSVGKYVPAGVPDIAGRAEVVGYTTSAGGAWSTGGGMSGTIWTRRTAAAISESGHAFDGQLKFTASNSNSIYGNSNTVQPPATQMYLYFYVGNFEQSAKEQTAGLNAELFNGKADIDDVANLAMPSSRYVDLTLGASGTQYTAPADGYLSCVLSVTTNGYVTMYSNYWQNGTVDGAYVGGWVPVRKGVKLNVDYAGLLQVVEFRFRYAVGAK